MSITKIAPSSLAVRKTEVQLTFPLRKISRKHIQVNNLRQNNNKRAILAPAKNPQHNSHIGTTRKKNRHNDCLNILVTLPAPAASQRSPSKRQSDSGKVKTG
jgi:hypothetical protein